MGNYLIKAVGIALVCLASLGLAGSVHCERLSVAILTSDTLTSTQRTMQGARKVIEKENPNAEFYTYLVTRDSLQNNNVVDNVKQLDPRLVLTIGSSATRLAQDHLEDFPVVFSAVKYPELSGFVRSSQYPGANMTGASLDIPTDIQFNYFKKILPSMKKVGVLYTQNTASLIPQARIVARQLGLELVALNVESDTELPDALDSLFSVVDGIWSVADHNLFSPKATRYILLNTVRKGIPFMGFSRYVVESGALCALDFDYKAVGLQAGRIANRIIAGERPDSISVTTADVIWFHYNENTAKRINVKIPEELAAIAKEVYR